MPDIAWWLVGNSHGGAHVGQGRTPAEARADVRRSIAETYAGEGLSPSASQQAAYSYHMRVIAGPLTHDQAVAARKAWDLEDWQTALRHARPAWRIQYGLPPRPVPIPDSAELEFVRNNKTRTVHVRPPNPQPWEDGYQDPEPIPPGHCAEALDAVVRGPGTPMLCGQRGSTDTREHLVTSPASFRMRSCASGACGHSVTGHGGPSSILAPGRSDSP